MKINSFQKYELDVMAYIEGKQASEANKSDPTKSPNPYPPDTARYESWNLGWNADIAWIEEIKGTLPDVQWID